MDTLTSDRAEGPTPVSNAELNGMLRCKRCNLNYLSSRSTSALRLTYCSFLCELGDLGFSMDGLEHMEPPKREASEAREPEPALAE